MSSPLAVSNAVEHSDITILTHTTTVYRWQSACLQFLVERRLLTGKNEALEIR